MIGWIIRDVRLWNRCLVMNWRTQAHGRTRPAPISEQKSTQIRTGNSNYPIYFTLMQASHDIHLSGQGIFLVLPKKSNSLLIYLNYFQIFNNCSPLRHIAHEAMGYGLPKRHFPAGLPVKILKALLPSSILATWPAQFNILDFIILTILGER